LNDTSTGTVGNSAFTDIASEGIITGTDYLNSLADEILNKINKTTWSYVPQT
jgi:hypothetical protein